MHVAKSPQTVCEHRLPIDRSLVCDTEAPPIEDLHTMSHTLLQQNGLRKRGRPPLTMEDRALREETKARSRRLGGVIQPEDRWRVKEPSAASRHDILQRLDAAAESDSICQATFWEQAEEDSGLPRDMLKRYSKPEEKQKLKTWMANDQRRDARGSNRRCWKRFLTCYLMEGPCVN